MQEILFSSITAILLYQHISSKDDKIVEDCHFSNLFMEVNFKQ